MSGDNAARRAHNEHRQHRAANGEVTDERSAAPPQLPGLDPVEPPLTTIDVIKLTPATPGAGTPTVTLPDGTRLVQGRASCPRVPAQPVRRGRPVALAGLRLVNLSDHYGVPTDEAPAGHIS